MHGNLLVELCDRISYEEKNLNVDRDETELIDLHNHKMYV